MCGIAHGGLINTPDPEEGNRYPIHQTCISVSNYLLDIYIPDPEEGNRYPIHQAYIEIVGYERRSLFLLTALLLQDKSSMTNVCLWSF